MTADQIREAIELTEKIDELLENEDYQEYKIARGHTKSLYIFLMQKLNKKEIELKSRLEQMARDRWGMDVQKAI